MKQYAYSYSFRFQACSKKSNEVTSGESGENKYLSFGKLIVIAVIAKAPIIFTAP